MRTLIVVIASFLFLSLFTSRADAMPPGPQTFCDTYPEAPECGSADVQCAFCHNGGPPALNNYGISVSAALLPGAPRPLSAAAYESALPTALRAIEDDDADGDGFSNYEEIIEGSAPGNGDSKPLGNACPENEFYNLCDYDHVFTYKRVSLDFCGRSPTFDEVETFRAMSVPEKENALDTKLAGCLDGEFWQGQDGVLWNIANRKIRPVETLKGGDDPGAVAIGDYDHDYNLFVYSQLDDHDARDAMTAKYFVKREGPTSLRPLAFNEEATEFGGVAASENVTPPFRAGLLTSRWTLVYFEMFSILPRAAAAQASRAFLREDWARMEGLAPVDVPIDFDNAGVSAPLCEVCHSTIDPAAEAWKNYAGFVGGAGGFANFVPDRMNLFEPFFPGISNMGTGWFKGEPVTDLMDWASKAANSDAFAGATVMDYWQLTVDSEPTGASEIDEFNALWQDLMSTDNYRVEPMLFKLIRTRAYGEP